MAASVTASQMITASSALRTPTTSVQRVRSLRVRYSLATASEERAALGPGTGALESMGCGQDRSIGVAAPHDLQAHRQSGVAEAHRNTGRGLPGEVERVREGHPSEDGHRVAGDLAGRALPGEEGRDRHRGSQEEIEALEEAA